MTNNMHILSMHMRDMEVACQPCIRRFFQLIVFLTMTREDHINIRHMQSPAKSPPKGILNSQYMANDSAFDAFRDIAFVSFSCLRSVLVYIVYIILV